MNPCVHARGSSSVCWLALLTCSACVGTLEDSLRGASAVAASATPMGAALDAGSAGPDGAADAGAIVRDAGQLPVVGVTAEERPRDGSVPAPLDAGSAQVQAATDAAAVCDFSALMSSRCGSAACHGVGGASASLDLVSSNLRSRLSGRTAAGSCAGTPLVSSDVPEESSLYLRVSGQACGARMPLGGVLTPAEQSCILQWLAGSMASNAVAREQ